MYSSGCGLLAHVSSLQIGAPRFIADEITDETCGFVQGTLRYHAFCLYLRLSSATWSKDRGEKRKHSRVHLPPRRSRTRRASRPSRSSPHVGVFLRMSGTGTKVTGKVRDGMVRYGMVRCRAVWHSMVRCGTVRYHAVHYFYHHLRLLYYYCCCCHYYYYNNYYSYSYRCYYY